jgi:hypothetical protein
MGCRTTAIVGEALTCASGLDALSDTRESPLEGPVWVIPQCVCPVTDAVVAGDSSIESILEGVLPSVTIATVTEYVGHRERVRSGTWSFKFSARDSLLLQERSNLLRELEEADPRGIDFFRYCFLRNLPIGGTWSFPKRNDIVYFTILMGRAPQELITSILQRFLPLRWSQVLGDHFPAAVHPGILAME